MSATSAVRFCVTARGSPSPRAAPPHVLYALVTSLPHDFAKRQRHSIQWRSPPCRCRCRRALYRRCCGRRGCVDTHRASPRLVPTRTACTNAFTSSWSRRGVEVIRSGSCREAFDQVAMPARPWSLVRRRQAGAADAIGRRAAADGGAQRGHGPRRAPEPDYRGNTAAPPHAGGEPATQFSYRPTAGSSLDMARSGGPRSSERAADRRRGPGSRVRRTSI